MPGRGYSRCYFSSFLKEGIQLVLLYVANGLHPNTTDEVIKSGWSTKMNFKWGETTWEKNSHINCGVIFS